MAEVKPVRAWAVLDVKANYICSHGADFHFGDMKKRAAAWTAFNKRPFRVVSGEFRVIEPKRRANKGRK